MNFSLSKPDFTKYFTSKTKYSIAITANDSITKKFPVVLEDVPLKVTLFWHSQFDELAQLKNFDAFAMPVHYHLTVGEVLLPPSSNGTRLFTRHTP
jgi:hypothetical protein